MAIFGCNGVMVLYLGTDVMLMPKPTAMVICWLLRHGDVMLRRSCDVVWFGFCQKNWWSDGKMVFTRRGGKSLEKRRALKRKCMRKVGDLLV